jgi:glycosyltransferase involved in cell wall biosynthesis
VTRKVPGNPSASHAEGGFPESATVAICVYTMDRWATLHSAIEAVQKQMASDDELIVVVDYNDSLLKRCVESLDGCTVIPNSHRRGLSGARNTALHAAHGSIIVFLDDDAVPLDGWLDALRAPYADELVYGVGGLTNPRWLHGQPRWFPEEFLWVIGCSHRGLPSRPQPVRNLIGANMSFRKVAFELAGGFVEEMGRIRNRPLGCEETEFSIRLTQAEPKAILLFDPSAEIEHHVTQQRGSLGYFARRCWAEGLSKAEVSRRVGRVSALSAERDYASRVLPKAIWRGLSDSMKGDIWGVARSGAMVFGLVVTAAGYCVGTLFNAPATGARGQM